MAFYYYAGSTVVADWVLGLLLFAAVLAAVIYFDVTSRLSDAQRRIVVGLLIAVTLGSAAIRADVILPLCTEGYLRMICSEQWWWCGVLKGCWFF